MKNSVVLEYFAFCSGFGGCVFCLFQVQSLCYLAFGFEFLLSYPHVPDTGAMLSSGITIYLEISPRYVDLFFEPRISPGRGGETLTPAWLIG